MVAPSLTGEYVRIDPLNVKEDVPLLWDALGGNDGTINERLKWYGMEDFESQQDLSKLLQSIEEPEGCCVNILRLASTNQIAGMASYIATVADHGVTEIGYVAHGPAMERSPASTEAHYLLAKHCFETMEYRRYEWKCDSNNIPSGNAALRYGFTFEGKFRQHRVTARNTNRDTHYYSMIDSEWPHRKHVFELWLSSSNFDANGQQKKKLQFFREQQQES